MARRKKTAAKLIEANTLMVPQRRCATNLRQSYDSDRLAL
jgi:hypothetical protein